MCFLGPFRSSSIRLLYQISADKKQTARCCLFKIGYTVLTSDGAFIHVSYNGICEMTEEEVGNFLAVNSL